MGKVLAKVDADAFSPRGKLAEAIAERNRARRSRDKTAAACERSEQLKRDAEQKFASFDDLDSKVTEAQMAQMRAGNTMTLSVPPKLVTQLADRDAARVALEAEAEEGGEPLVCISQRRTSGWPVFIGLLRMGLDSQEHWETILMDRVLPHDRVELEHFAKRLNRGFP